MPDFEIMKREAHPRYIVKKRHLSTYEARCWTLWGARAWIRRYERLNMYGRVS